jgi:hypothetical protein
MTFTRARPAGWTDGVDAITAPQLNQIDVNISRALDGYAGGSYAPNGLITLDGSAGVNVATANTLTVQGQLNMSGTQTQTGGLILLSRGQISQRILNVPDSDLTFQGGRVDVVTIPADLTGNRTYTVLATSPVPVTGHMLKIVRSLRDIAGAMPSIYRATIDFGGAVPTDFLNSRFAYWTIMWDGSAWYPVEWSTTTVDLALAIADSWS